jgi:hypothetical protein
MTAWNHWYHVTSNTYGTWLPGDPRGWRERGHKKHVEGDYKNPPPHGSGEEVYRRAGSLLAQPPVHLDVAQREMAGRALVEMLLQQGIEILAVSLGAIHFHALGRFTDRQVRPRVGRAKKHACFKLREQGFRGRLWETGSGVLPIADRQHQLNVFGYIVRHAEEGAWVWTFREGLYWEESSGG